MGGSLFASDQQLTAEVVTQRVRRQLDADCDLGRFTPCPPETLDQVATASVDALWTTSRIKSFIPVLAVRQAREALIAPHPR